MKKFLLGVVASLIVMGAVAFKAAYDIKPSTAEVEQMQGIYIFAKSKPVSEYDHLGIVSGPAMGSHEFDNLVEVIVKRVKKDFPSANAIIFDGKIGQTHNTKVSAVKLK